MNDGAVHLVFNLHTSPELILWLLIGAGIAAAAQMLVNVSYDWKKRPKPPRQPFDGPLFPPF